MNNITDIHGRIALIGCDFILEDRSISKCCAMAHITLLIVLIALFEEGF